MTSRTVFMVMPFNDKTANAAYNSCIKPLCQSFNLTIRRADELYTTNVIYDDIVREIEQADIVICDVSGRNPNVFYELGISHSIKKDSTIILTHDEYEEAPFEIKHFRIFSYKDSIEGTESLRTQINNCLKIILNDFDTIYSKEFELIFKIMKASGKSELVNLVGLQELDELNIYDRFEYEGEVDGMENGGMSISPMDSFGTFLELQYVQMSNKRLILTDVGKAFVKFLKARDVKCHFVNGKTLTSGHIRFKDRPNR